MKFRAAFWLLFVLCFAGVSVAEAQIDSLVAQITSSSANSFVRDISGDGRFIVFESTGDIATERNILRNNADGNTEIFLFDYAQRRIFQITNTRRILSDNAGSPTAQANIVVDITNTRPVIANQLVNNELWIAFTSNATTSVGTREGGGMPNGTNPGNFDGTTLSATDRTQVIGDGNTEIWLYRVLVTTPSVNLSSGIEPAFNNLSAGTFQQVTNTSANSPTQPGSSTVAPFISDDNRDVSIDDTASTLAFVSNRNFATDNAPPNDNAEIFVYKRSTNSFQQITLTPRATENAPIFTQNPSISGDGTRLAFYSNASVPRNPTVVPVTNSDNADNNGEVFYAVLSANGQPSAFTQVTRTTRTNPSDTTVIFSAGRRISRDGRFVGFETLSNTPAGGGTNQGGFQLYVFDSSVAQTNASAYRAVGPRGDADAAAQFGDVRRFPTFTLVYNRSTNTFEPGVVFASRLNFTPAGTVPSTASEGLNPDAARQVQIYSFPLTQTSGFTAAITRLTRFPTSALNEVQPYTSNTSLRIAFNIPRELGGGNADSTSEAFYLLTPIAITSAQTPVAPIEVPSRFAFTTGASGRAVGTPEPTPTASPSPTPQTPLVVQGLAPGTLAIAQLEYGRLTVSQTATGTSVARAFPLPIELGGVTLSINNAAAGIYSIDRARSEVVFVVPIGLAAGTYQLVLNDNGRISRTTIEIVAARPDIFRRDNVIAGSGRASVFNATTGVALQSEPFPIRSIRLRGGYNVVQTRLRVFLTGVQGLPASAFTIRIGNLTIPTANILTGATQTDRPGVYSIDFLLPPEANTLGDVPIVITVTSGTTSFSTRLDDTAPRIRILP
ncbi:MAG: hypothetical protein M3209_08215 [Acidobacteriota bacterium]|nr:hypothetical protein [Acidobacteriota bacterium]